jgi:hypothetical protein
MRTLTAVTPATPTLPPDLALLLAPIRFAAAASVAEGYAGHAQGVILDDEGTVIAFVVRLSPKLAAGSPRTLVSASAMTVTDDSMLLLEWPQDRLLAQPRLDDDLQGEQGSAPVEGSPPGDIPPSTGGDMDAKMALKEGAQGTAIGAVFGALVGLATVTPIGVLAFAAFFATGGGLLGVISGASEGSPMKTGCDDTDPEHHNPSLRALERELRNPALSTLGLVSTTRFSPPTAAPAAPVQHQSSAA